MGLKQDLIDGVVKATRETGFPDERDLDTSTGSTIERNAEYMKEAIVDFLTKCEFRITQLNAPVILEDLKIPPQQGDVLPSVQALGANGGGPVTTNVTNGTNGVITKNIDVDKTGGTTGILESSGYVYIGEDPDSQDSFDVDGESGQREFTTVKLIREDIEDLL
tara:strand:- start:575 stop:1066 length:492 start_codon:yes stop_codon:yes gene_type:complete